MAKPVYCTDEELRDYLRIPVGDAQDLAAQTLAVAAASRAVDKACARSFGYDAAPTTRYYTAGYSRARGGWFVKIDDVFPPTDTVVVASDSAGTGVYAALPAGERVTFWPLNAGTADEPYTHVRVGGGVTAVEGSVAVTARFGWPQVPDAVKQATLLQSSRFLARRDSPYGVAGSPDVGSELRLLSKLDPDVEVSLAPYKRTWAAV